MTKLISAERVSLKQHPEIEEMLDRTELTPEYKNKNK